MSKPITAIIVGAGHRAMMYASYALQNPDALQIVGVADPIPGRCMRAAQLFGIDKNMIFSSAEELAEHPRLADAIINGTMDRDHVPTAIPLLKKGYHMLLEKPFAIDHEEIQRLVETAHQYHSTLLVCHVLRYAPFYTEIKKRLAAGEIGDIINIQATEHVVYHHYNVSYLRGKWRNEQECGAPMLLAKCCHDVDMILWLKGDVPCEKIASFGSDFQFAPDKRPPEAGTRCLVDCPKEADCLYSARKLILDHPDRWQFYVWTDLEDEENPTLEQKEEKLKTTNQFGRCAWNCGHTVVDHQTVMMQFADGATASLNMIGGSSKSERNLHILGTKGEIKGVFDDSKFVVRRIDPTDPKGYREEEVDLHIGGDKSGMTGSHGGGDLRLVEDFVKILQRNTPSISCTDIDDSIASHLTVFAAEYARKNDVVKNI